MVAMKPVNFAVRWGIIAATTALVWASLALGAEPGAMDLAAGDVAPDRYVAEEEITLPDTDATNAAKEAAAAAVEQRYKEDTNVTAQIEENIVGLFTQIKASVVATDPPLTVEVDRPALVDPETIPTTTVAGTTATTQLNTTTTSAVPTVTLSGLLFLDRTGDGFYSDIPTETSPEVDVPLVDVDMIFTDSAGVVTRVRTDAAGIYTATGISAGGPIVVEVDVRDPQFPKAFALSTENNPQVIEPDTDAPVEVASIGFTPFTQPISQQVDLLAGDYLIDTDPTQPSLATLVGVATDDVWRTAAGQAPQLPVIQDAAQQRAVSALRDGIKSGELNEVRQQVASERMFIPLEMDQEPALAAQDAARAVAGYFLEANSFADEATTDAAKIAATESVIPVLVTYKQDATIVEKGQVISQVQHDAIVELNLLGRTPTQYLALLVATAVVMAVLAFYISRFRPGVWASLRRVTLLGLLVVMLALAIRASAALGSVMDVLAVAGGYAVPAAAFGVMVAILFDARMAVLIAVAAAAITALATGDPGYTIYALLSGFIPVPFVASISRRADFGSAVLAGAVGSAAAAAAMAFFFHTPLVDESLALQTVGLSALVAGTVTMVTALAAGMAVSFFELTFDITTSLRLLDLTNRNHPGLQLLQDRAWGTFNHSLMVGTLADKAAASIGANNLLARAAAYYHDLGKTQNATHFIENQFGISNPHDEMSPAESAAVIRQHVSDGVALAREYRIPTEVADGILSHHGDGIMRFFYQKAKDLYGESAVNVDHYRHAGHKPRTKEMAILMMADALEGATRAVFSLEAPTPARIVEVVERVVGEKVNDGQLSESDLTLGELTQVKKAFVEALVGHYHQRIPYPNFPTDPGLPHGSPALAAPTDSPEPDEGSVDSDEDAPDVIPMRRQKER